MAIIGKIQEKGRYLLVGFVGLALLTFIFSGLQKCETTTNIPLGTIHGEDVDEKLYAKNLDAATQQDMMNFQQQGREYTERDKQQTADRAWNQTVTEQLLQIEFDALGIEVDDVELNNYLYGEDGFPLMPDIARSFSDSITGQFDAKKLDKFIDERENAKDPEAAKQWKETIESLRKQRQQEKYMQLLGQTVYVTKLEAKEEYTAQKEIKSVSFVLRNFRDIQDEDVKITDKEIRKFWEEHKDEKKYEMMAGRDVKYFDISIMPSKSDSNAILRKFKDIKKEFAASKTPMEDSLFVVTKSEPSFRFYSNSHRATFRPQNDPKAQAPLTYPMTMDTVFKTASIGQVVGPYFDNGKIRVAKVIDFNTKVCKVRHILIAAQKGGDAAKIASAKKLADSLVKIVNKDNFVEFVTKYSEDPGSKDKGGEYADFMDQDMVPEFSKFSTDEPIGKIGVVQTDFGFHIIEVLDRKEVKYPVLAVVEETVKPSSETQANLNDKAYRLLQKIDSKISKKSDLLAKLSLFDTIARREGYFSRPVRILDESPKVTGFNSTNAEQAIMKLAYDPDAEVGMLCSAPINDQGRYVIAMVSSIRLEKGAPTFEDSYDRMRMEAIKDKKAKKFIAQIGKTRNLDKLAKKSNTTVMTAEVTFANPSINGGGYEPEVVGSLFSGLKDLQTTKPLVGNAGVYVIRLNRTVKAPTAANYDMEKAQMLAQARGNLQATALAALQKHADVKDYRVFRQLGIPRD